MYFGALTDHLNSVRDLAQYDAGTDTTTIARHLVYDAFGNVTSDTAPAVPSLFLYTARPFDEHTGLQNNLNRWYDAQVGRWLSEDPIGVRSHDANLTAYVQNSPLLGRDPAGLTREDIVIMGSTVFYDRSSGSPSAKDIADVLEADLADCLHGLIHYDVNLNDYVLWPLNGRLVGGSKPLTTEGLYRLVDMMLVKTDYLNRSYVLALAGSLTEGVASRLPSPQSSTQPAFVFGNLQELYNNLSNADECTRIGVLEVQAHSNALFATWSSSVDERLDASTAAAIGAKIRQFTCDRCLIIVHGCNSGNWIGGAEHLKLLGKASGCTVAGTGGFAEIGRFVLTRDATVRKVSSTYNGQTYHEHIKWYAKICNWTDDQLANRLANTYDSKDNRWYIH